MCKVAPISLVLEKGNSMQQRLLALTLCAALSSAAFAGDEDVADSANKTDQGEVAVIQHPAALPADWSKGPFMEIYVRGFKDSNGDGHGDLNGITEKLDYIKSLGYTGIWLMPIFTSDDKNHGYAVKNYREIEPRYGKPEDLKRLLDEAHKRGIGIIVDYVINHSSDRHPLYIQSMEKGNKYRDWFLWKDGDKPEGWSGLNGESWYASNNAWYYAVFWDRMPDFNLKNPDVINFHVNNLKYWLNQGVDGFRFDAVAYLVENGSIGWENQPENYKLMHKIQGVLAQYQAPKYMVCEATTDAPGFAAADGCGSAFSFGLQKAIMKSVRYGRADRDLVAYVEKNPMNRMATFLSNHDAFAGNRVFNQVGGDMKAYRLATATQFLLPGTPYTLYGEELGIDLSTGAGGADEQIRAPIPWTAEDRIVDANNKPFYTKGGFTKLAPDKRNKMFRPLPDNWEKANVATEEKDPESILNFYRQLIALRKSSPVLTSGSFLSVTPMQLAPAVPAPKGKKAKGPQWQENANVFAFIRELDGAKVLVAINYSEQAQEVTLDTTAKKAAQLEALWPASPVSLPTDANGKIALSVPGSGFVVFKLNQ